MSSGRADASYVLRRLVAAVAGIFAAATLVFLILYWLPGDPAALIAGDDASPAMVANIQAKLGTNAPLWHQYITYIGHLLHGDLGTSFTTNEPVAHRLAGQLGASLQLTFCACLISVLAGVRLAHPPRSQNRAKITKQDCSFPKKRTKRRLFL